MAFCPNCGNREADTAAACSKCNTPMGGAAPSTKFKGTIMMGGASSAEVEAMVQKAKAAAQAGQAARAGTGSAPAAPAPAPAAAPAAARPSGEDALAYQATIMGPITSPEGKTPAGFPHPLEGGGEAEAGDDGIHAAPTMAFDPGSRGPGPEGGATMVEPGPPAGMGFTDERSPSMAPVTSGGGAGKIILILAIALVVLVGGGLGLYFAFRTPEVPTYPGYPMPGQPVVPGQVPGYPVPGQVPGFPAPGQVPGVPGVPPTP